MNKDIIPQETWKPVVGYEAYYEISDHGRIRSLDRIVKQRNMYKEITKTFPARMMTIRTDRYGYNDIKLRDHNSVRKGLKIHQLVAKAFIPNPEGKTQINHKDSDKTNNHYLNLEWCTIQENHAHAYKNGKHALNLHRDPNTGRMMSVAT